MAQPATDQDRDRRDEQATPRPRPRPQEIEDEEPAAEAVMGLDQLLVGAARGPLRRMVPPARTLLHLAGGLAAKPGTAAKRGVDLAAEIGRVVRGHSDVEPGPKDKRWADPAWTGNPLLHRLMQAYLAAGKTVSDLVADAELDWQDDERMRFAAANLLDALAPSNNPVVNPLTYKAVLDTGGRSVASGLRRLVSDLATAPRVPTMVDPDAFTVGKDLAVTPGAVVLRTPVFELLQYTPTTETVREVPLLMVPPTINKYYVADLAPGRSIVEYHVSQGQRVFMMSWRNPDARHRDWGMDTYGQAVLDAMDAVEKITGCDRTALLSFCSGGIISAMVLAHLAARGEQDRVVGAGFAVTVLDWTRAGTLGAFIDEEAVNAATEKSRKKGYLDGATLAEIFAWLRPNDLVWNYWVNNYLQGKAPKAFDILYWNGDSTRMTAGLHRDFINMSVRNSLARPDEATMLGSPVDLGKVTIDSYVAAGIADHICPWQNCYRTTQLLGGKTRFVLSTNGHIASLVNPPDNPKSTWRTAPTNPADPDEFLAEAHVEKGSWWTDFSAWLGERSGDQVPAPSRLGSDELPVLGEAPGTYVFDK